MQLRPSVPFVFCALLLGWPKSSPAMRSDPPLGSNLLSDSTALELSRLAGSLEGKRSFALTERLDEIVSSDEYRRLSSALQELDAISSDELTRVLDEFEFADLEAPIGHHQLRPLLARTYGAIVATSKLMPQPWLKDAIVAMDALESGIGGLVEDRDEPVRVRRYLRHILRGTAALMCVPFVVDNEPLQRELLAHAAVGAETSLRFAAAVSPNRALARDLLDQLRLEPIDLEVLERQREELAVARASLREAQQHVPGFRLPPRSELPAMMTPRAMLRFRHADAVENPKPNRPATR